ncbi:hypothetical protein DVU_0231 [Nitratidesulfovibrio vulgaris str. Hildenborough]|uniref:Uncharacterized protein n=1 Tax=Nitratidesulfovibrio vulgaris (strain ATCC 29579 / DSM 644 / CCUG 34227 / NCIMB 8303 / VKM B-1760 / Hildenborough) TaxID=882 RepID=Q72FI2_NITV2|nr:hypothetical protein DVU_0231 [Nitratidesulfovibrio vulgaris str. Hildenborough]
MRMHPSAVLAERAHAILRQLDELFDARGVTQADKAALVPARLAVRRVRDRHRSKCSPMGNLTPESSAMEECHDV